MKSKDLLYLGLYHSLKFIVKLSPNFVLKFLVFLTARIAFKLNKEHRKIIDTNLKICFSELNQTQRNKLSLKIYENLAKFGIEFLQNQNANKEQILQKTRFINEHFLKEALNSNRALVLTTAHFSNWELSSLAYAAKFGAISVVGRKLDSVPMNEILSQNRTKFDIELIDKKGGLRQMLNALKKGRALGILTDQDCADKESLKLEFFGKKVNYQIGASVLAKRCEALLIPVYVYRENENFCLEFHKPMDSKIASIEELTLYQAKTCEKMIKLRPCEYFFFHKRFASFDRKIYENQ